MGPKTSRLLVALTLLSGLAGCPSDDEGGTAAMAGMGAEDTEGGLPIVPCPDDLPAFTLGLEATGESSVYKVRIEDAVPSPPEKYTNDWTVTIVDMDDQPVPEAEIEEVRPFMPVHGHDGTFPPEVEALDADGEYQVDKINMWMRGPWEVQFRLRGDAGQDYAVFKVCIEG